MSDVTPADVAVCLRVLQAAAPPLRHREAESDAVIDLRELLLPHLQVVQRREKQRQRYAAKAATADPKAVQSQSPALAVMSAASVATAPSGVVVLGVAHLSRPLYANPVCFLSTWTRDRASNLMTISWLAPLDNDGHFTLSMNATRHSAQKLAANPVLCLSVACAGLEPLLLRVGGCTGARLSAKAETLGVPLCRPGWAPLEREDAKRAATATLRPEPEDHRESADGGGDGCDEGDGCNGDGQTDEAEAGGGGLTNDLAVAPSKDSDDAWGGRGPLPADDESRCYLLPRASPEEVERQLAGAVAVTPCVAHVVARVETVRLVHGHLQLTCETLSAHVREEYWSGKTLEPQRPELPPPLNFLGSQRFVQQQRGASAELS